MPLQERRAKKLLRKKKNESWTMQRRSWRGLTSPTLGVGGNLYAKSSSLVRSGEHIRLGCWFRRRAETIFFQPENLGVS
ncbi:MAG: hypothetical protein DMF11_09540 [Verrucomicrobia bacterium]|nr:MAG: hypothetical protein DMF11_09540 [Verrucomicrobiota bacterium]